MLPERGDLGTDLEAAGVELLIRPLSVLRRELMTPRGVAELTALAARDAVALSSLIRRRQIALVHSNTSVILSGAAGAAAARIPHVWHVREIYARFGRAWPAYRRVLASAVALPCVSPATAAQFGGRGRTRVIADGLAVDPHRAPRQSARAALGLSDDRPAIAVLGRISDWKGQDVLVRALAEPALRERGVVGLLAGDPWPGAQKRLPQVLELAGRLGVSDRLRVLGFREDLDNVLGAADVIAVPSTAPDPLPGAAIEAAAAGCAVIASAHGGLPEIIRDHETGRLVPPGDAGALARVARELIDDAPQRERLGTAASADVRIRFAPGRLLDSIQDLYDEILRGGAR
ncbi:MAG: glycosyltransferase [Solirubrobacteraceae bacterium]